MSSKETPEMLPTDRIRDMIKTLNAHIPWYEEGRIDWGQRRYDREHSEDREYHDNKTCSECISIAAGFPERDPVRTSEAVRTSDSVREPGFVLIDGTEICPTGLDGLWTAARWDRPYNPDDELDDDRDLLWRVDEGGFAYRCGKSRPDWNAWVEDR